MNATLSKKQMKVAYFVASGLSNKEVASRLGISRKTVENHIQKIYVKLGIMPGNRVRLANIWHGVTNGEVQ